MTSITREQRLFIRTHAPKSLPECITPGWTEDAREAVRKVPALLNALEAAESERDDMCSWRMRTARKLRISGAK